MSDLSKLLHERIARAEAEIAVCRDLLRAINKDKPTPKALGGMGIPAPKRRRSRNLSDDSLMLQSMDAVQKCVMEELTFDWKTVADIAAAVGTRASNLYIRLRSLVASGDAEESNERPLKFRRKQATLVGVEG